MSTMTIWYATFKALEQTTVACSISLRYRICSRLVDMVITTRLTASACSYSSPLYIIRSLVRKLMIMCLPQKFMAQNGKSHSSSFYSYQAHILFGAVVCKVVLHIDNTLYNRKYI